MMQASELEKARRLVLDRLESLRRAGVQQLPKGRRAPEPCERPDVVAAEPDKTESRMPNLGAAHSVPLTNENPANRRIAGWQPLGSGVLFGSDDQNAISVSTATDLPVLQQEVMGCTRCEQLARTRTQTVFGVGNPNARLCFAGEAPGADEDRLGEPFVGRAGQLLNKIIEACRMKREDIYILNMIKCRPPGNRNPLPQELANCRGYLERQLALIRPEFICCLGAVAAQNLLGTTLSIGKLRGKVHNCRGARLVCTYHPAYLLRNPSAKKDTWEDMKLLMREMGVGL
jgi:DNA polymerase